MEPNWLSPREDRAWRAFQHAHHQLGVHLTRGLQESGLSGADYQILAVLSGHDGDRMPAHDPAELDMLAALNERVLRHLAKDDDSPAEDEPSIPSKLTP
jgi:hypothetical protein